MIWNLPNILTWLRILAIPLVALVFLFGAPAHQDIWDLKPDAPSMVRGEFRPVASRVAQQ